VKVRWSPEAAALAQRFMRDQEGMRAIVAAVDALQDALSRLVNRRRRVEIFPGC
jgi:hypothetical protein